MLLSLFEAFEILKILSIVIVKYREEFPCQLLYSLTNAATSVLPKVKTSDAVRLLTFRQTAFEVGVAQSTTQFPCVK